MSMSDAKPGTTSFRDLKLSEPLIRVLDEIGYETPTPIQSQAIPLLMNGRDNAPLMVVMQIMRHRLVVTKNPAMVESSVLKVYMSIVN